MASTILICMASTVCMSAMCVGDLPWQFEHSLSSLLCCLLLPLRFCRLRRRRSTASHGGRDPHQAAVVIKAPWPRPANASKRSTASSVLSTPTVPSWYYASKPSNSLSHPIPQRLSFPKFFTLIKCPCLKDMLSVFHIQ